MTSQQDTPEALWRRQRAFEIVNAYGERFAGLSGWKSRLAREAGTRPSTISVVLSGEGPVGPAILAKLEAAVARDSTQFPPTPVVQPPKASGARVDAEIEAARALMSLEPAAARRVIAWVSQRMESEGVRERDHAAMARDARLGKAVREALGDPHPELVGAKDVRECANEIAAALRAEEGGAR